MRDDLRLGEFAFYIRRQAALKWVGWGMVGGLGIALLLGVVAWVFPILTRGPRAALSMGIIALVVNKMAGLALEMPGVGVVAAAAVLVVGHLFSVVINLLGAFVHSCRLQYVEFFTKFYESGGKAFSPFRFQNRYITIAEPSRIEG